MSVKVAAPTAAAPAAKPAAPAPAKPVAAVKPTPAPAKPAAAKPAPPKAAPVKPVAKPAPAKSVAAPAAAPITEQPPVEETVAETPTTEGEVEITREQLIVVATELNTTLNPDPLIPLEPEGSDQGVNDDELANRIVKTAALFVPEDQCTDDTKKILALLGFTFPTAPAAAAPAAAPAKPAKKTAAAKPAAPAKQAKPAAPAKQAKPAAPVYSRGAALADVINAAEQNTTWTTEQLVGAADAQYAAQGKNSNLKESMTICRTILPALVGVGVLSRDGDNITKC